MIASREVVSASAPLAVARENTTGAAGGEVDRRLPSLDGLRAVSIAFVLFAHCVGTRGFPLASFKLCGDLGGLGVRVFFVISGFLITSLLLQELRETRRVDLPRFYARRSLRIFPPCYLFIAVVWLLDAFGWVRLRPYDVLHAVTYTMNHHPEHAWELGHLWSLAVEEQFYLLWPAVLALAGVRRAMWVAGISLAVCPLIRLGMIYLLGTYVGLGKVFPTVADALATGCLLAGLRGALESEGRYLRFLQSRWFLLVPVALIVCNALAQGRPTIMSAVGATTLNLCIVLCLHWCVLFPFGRVGRLLNSRSFVAVGVLSYSLYLWQQLFINRGSSLLANAFPLNLILSASLAVGSYYLLERPLLGLRKRLRSRSMPGSLGPVPQALVPRHSAPEAPVCVLSRQ